MDEKLDTPNVLQCIRRAGSGLYGVVWEADQHGRKVAVKVIHPEMQHVANAMDHFRALARVDSHPNVVTVYSVEQVLLPGEMTPVLAVIMEWIEGKTLGACLTGPRFSTTEAIDIGCGIVDGITYIHSKGIPHGDLHPGNVILATEGPKIIDIDCSETNSLAKLTTNSQQVLISGDVDYLRFVLWRTVAHSDIDLDLGAQFRQSINDAESCDEFSRILQSLKDSLTERSVSDGATDIATANAPSASERIATLIDNAHFATLRDVVIGDALSAKSLLLDPKLGPNEPVVRETYQFRVNRYEEILRPIIGTLAIGTYFDKPDTTSLWCDVIELLANCYEDRGLSSGMERWLDLERYVGCVLMYSSGISAVASNRYNTLFHILNDPTFTRSNDSSRLSSEIWIWQARERDVWNEMMGDERRKFYSPIGMRLELLLRESVRRMIPLDSRYISTFDRFEYFGALQEFHNGKFGARDWGPFGSFAWRSRRGGTDLSKIVREEANSEKDDWAPLKAGFFSGSFQEFDETYLKYHEHLNRVRGQLGMF